MKGARNLRGMRLHFELLKLGVRKIILRQNTGVVLRKFCEKMGVAYIKFAQILAMQNFGDLFTEEDRVMLAGICDDCNPVDFKKIQKILSAEYGEEIEEIFAEIEPKPVGAASISQVHRAKLKTGEIVAVKVKRCDVTQKLEKDVAKMRKLVHRYGWLVKFRNYVGGDRVLELYLDWIREETDFAHEQQNIRTYDEFAKVTNGKVRGAREIRVPKLFEGLCTENVIVMEFIESPTVNKMELSDGNKRRIAEALNSYIRLSFWALFHDGEVVFHGDPHGGNVYVEKDGAVGFLDMGLLFVLSKEDQALIKQFFLAAYARNVEKLYELLIPYAQISEAERRAFRKDLEKYCQEIGEKEITSYFMDMIAVCLKYQFLPPNFLFCMAKAFVCLNGIAGFTGNVVRAQELLGEQVAEFLVERSFEDCRVIVKRGMTLLPEVLERGAMGSLAQGIAHGMKQTEEMCREVRQALGNIEETLEILRVAS